VHKLPARSLFAPSRMLRIRTTARRPFVFQLLAGNRVVARFVRGCARPSLTSSAHSRISYIAGSLPFERSHTLSYPASSRIHLHIIPRYQTMAPKTNSKFWSKTKNVFSKVTSGESVAYISSKAAAEEFWPATLEVESTGLWCRIGPSTRSRTK